MTDAYEPKHTHAYGAMVRALREARGLTTMDVALAVHRARWPDVPPVGTDLDFDVEAILELEASETAWWEMGARSPSVFEVAAVFGLDAATTDRLYAAGDMLPRPLERNLLACPEAWDEVRAVLARHRTTKTEPEKAP